MKKRIGRTLWERILAPVFALLVCAAAWEAFPLRVSAAPEEFSAFYITNSGGSVIDYIAQGAAVNIEFNFLDTPANLKPGEVYETKDFQLNSNWSKDKNSSKLILTVPSKPNADGKYDILARLEDVTYRSGSRQNRLQITGITINGASYDSLITEVPSEYFSRTSSGGETESNPYISDIIVENVYVRDPVTDEIIDQVDKDSSPFIVEVVFVDRGLRQVDSDQFSENFMSVYMTNFGGFVSSAGAKGTLHKALNSDDDYPRFRARFRGMRYEGGSNVISMSVTYDVHGWEVEGEANSIVVHQAKEDDGKDKLAPLTPHIIVSQYSYGERQIMAGDGFTLSLSMQNTSADIPLENIVITITPETIKSDTAGSTSGGLTITSASNTYYIKSLEVGESFSHSIDLQAEPNAAVGSHKVAVSFKFQYVDEVNKERKDGEDTENIAIPVTQIDRFSVDPLTDFSEAFMLGDEGYLTIGFINRGKSTTYNVSGIITGDNILASGQSQHFGNLEAGKAGTLEFSVQAMEAGDLVGEVTILYEDDNTNQKEITVPFQMFVEEPYMPPMEPGPGMEEPPPESAGPPVASIVLCSAGGLFIAVPLMLYIIKRVNAKGREEFDEDF